MNQDEPVGPQEQKEILDESSTTDNPYGPTLISDIFLFPWIPLRSTMESSEYVNMGDRGSVSKIFGLAILNGISPVVILIMLIGGNPYIDLAYDLNYLPFIWVFISLIPVSFLIHTSAHFLCYRGVSGRGNLVAHSYLEVLAATTMTLLLWLAIALLYITRSDGLGNVLIVLGGIYLLYPSFISLREIHRILTGRAMVGLVLSVIASIPLIFLYLYSFARFREAIPYEIYDWRLILHFGVMLLIVIFILGYMLQQQKLSRLYPDGVSLLRPLKDMFRRWWVILLFSIFLIALAVIFVFDSQYQSFYTKLPSYSGVFLPQVDEDLLYVYTKTTSNESDYSQSALEIWDIANQKRLDIVQVPFGFLLRPNKDEKTLVISHHWDPNSVFDPRTREIIGQTGFLGGNDPYNPTYNPVRDEFYGLAGKHRLGFHRLVVYDDNNERKELNYYYIRGEIHSVAVHPNGEYIFVVGDNFIDTLKADNLELVDTMQLGGKLRDLAVSPDGKNLYAMDAVWRRVRIVPSPIIQ